VLLIAAIVVAQTKVGAIKGSVIDTTGTSLRGVAVEIVGSPTSARTDTTGHYRFNNLPVGRYIVHVGHVARQVDVVADTAVSVDLMARDVAAPRAVWEGCKPFGTCRLMRYVATFREHDIRDAATWAAFLSRHATGPNTGIRDDIVDWPHEMLVIVSYGAGTQRLDPGDGINRVESHPDRLTILLGPDSSAGPLNTAGWVPATVIAVKRTTLPVEYRAILSTTHVPPTVDWSVQ
jgi:carboxypeptidase family protein